MKFCTCGLKYEPGEMACSRCGREHPINVPIAEEVPEDVIAALAEKEAGLERTRRREIVWQASPAYFTLSLLQSLAWAFFTFAAAIMGCFFLGGVAIALKCPPAVTAAIMLITAFSVGTTILLLLLCGTFISLIGWFFASKMRRTLTE